MDISPDTAHASIKRVAPQYDSFPDFQTEFLLAADTLAGLTSAYLAEQACRLVAPRVGSGANESMFPPLILLSIIGALLLRKPELVADRHSPRSDMHDTVNWRAWVALLGLVAVTIIWQIGAPDSFPVPLVWLSFLVCWIGFSRFAVLAYLRHKAAHRPNSGIIVAPAASLSDGRSVYTMNPDCEATNFTDLQCFEENEDALEDSISTGAVSEPSVLVDLEDVSMLILAIENDEVEDLAPLIDQLKPVPERNDTVATSGSIRANRDLWATLGLQRADSNDRPLQGWSVFAKIVIDRLGAAILLILLSPFMSILALVIVSNSAGPVIFRQRRSGWSGRLFTLYKFRTMYHGRLSNCDQTRRNDPRCTTVGAVLRRTSLDELPQLWNVLVGDMSLVGPRPHAEFLHTRDRAGCELVADYAKRQWVKPGMTGWAQVHGLRGAIVSPAQLRRRVEFDLYYIDHWSLMLDFRILAMTPFAVMRAENAF